eukprot:scaffold2702_cov168-Amphora_coffeaeformis.AAC.7
MSDNNNNNDGNDAGREEREDDCGGEGSHKRMRPETAALQLLELSGQTSVKRARTESYSGLGSESVTKTQAEEGERDSGPFDDASLADQNITRTTGKAGTQSQESTTAITKSIKDFDQFIQDGQFDDASEEDADVPNIPLLCWKDGREKDLPSQQAATPSPVPPGQARQVPPRQVDVPLPRYPVAASGFMLNSEGYPLIAPAPLPRAHHQLHPLPIAPRPVPSQLRTFADGPLAEHPNPLLEPDAKMDDHLRLRAMPPVVADTEYRRFPVYRPLPTDILLGRGGRSNHHAGNEWFREFVQLYRPTYHRIEKFNKMQLATNLVNYVRHCGGRFLQQVKITTPTATVPQPLSVWFEAGDVRAREKCSQCLREVSSSDGSIKPAASNNKAGAPKKMSRRKSSGSSSNNNNPSTSQSRTSTPRTVPSRRPSTTSTITTHATETDGLFCDEQDPDGDDPGMLTI